VTYFRSLHKWLGVMIALGVSMLALTGLALQHYPVIKSFLVGVQTPSGRHAESPFSQPIQVLEYAPWARKTVWVANPSGVFVSVDDAKTFKRADLPKKNKRVVRLFFEGNQSIIIWFSNGQVWGSNDQGKHFIRETLPSGITRIFAVTQKEKLWVFSSNKGVFKGNFERGFRVVGDVPAEDLKQLIHDLHTGHFWEPVWPIVNSVTAVGLLILVFTGLKLFKRPKKRR
jgi:uncharacterized iron-regulated membrane protein